MPFMIPSVFMLQEPVPIVQQALALLASPIPEPNWRITRADNFAAAEMAGAKLILEHFLSLESVDMQDFGSYLDQANVHLERAKSWGYSQLITVPIAHQVQSELDAVAPTLSLLTVYAEVCLAATAWAVHDQMLALQYLISGYAKALAVAQVRLAKSVPVDEELDIQISSQIGYRKGIRLKGYRPEPGSAAYLAQDIQLAQVVVEGHRLSIEVIDSVYSKGNRIIDERPRKK